MKTIGIITKFDVDRSPRPKRLAACLSGEYQVTIIGPGKCKAKQLVHLVFELEEKRSLYVKFINLLNLMGRNYEPYLKRKYRPLINAIDDKKYDLLIVHDIEILPIVVNMDISNKVIFDAREYFPLHYEDSLAWRILYKNLNHYLCLKYLNRADEMLTVSPGLQLKYQEVYGKKSKLFESWPQYTDITPSSVNEKIRIIYHGGANANRKLELMIFMMDYLDDRFTLDLILVDGARKYLHRLQSEVAKRPSVKIIKPVEQNDVVNFCAKYDIGIFICPPTTFNLKHALPNKLFEYIQSRLMVAISPSIDMVNVVRKYDLGVIADEFTPESMAHKLNKLTYADIERYKNNANKAAKLLTAENNCITIKELVSGLI